MDNANRITRLELAVLVALLRLGDRAYGMTILEELRERGESVLRPTVYETLRRLERKGLLESEIGDPLPERGGRARRYYRVTDDGRAAMRAAREDWERLWGDADRLLERS